MLFLVALNGPGKVSLLTGWFSIKPDASLASSESLSPFTEYEFTEYGDDNAKSRVER